VNTLMMKLAAGLSAMILLGGFPIFAQSPDRQKAPDLTTLTERNKGTFPAAMVEDVIRGGTQSSKAAHGSSEMPVWGPIFKGLDTRNDVNEARIENRVKYIESIQAKAKTE